MINCLASKRIRLLITAVFVLLSSGFAVAEERAERPSYQFLRWQEDWSAIGRSNQLESQSWDAVKFLPWGDGDKHWLTLGGDFRVRGEYWSGFNFGAPQGISHEDGFVLSRYRLHGDMHFAEKTRLFAEIKGAYASDRDLPGGVRAIDEDQFELEQLFLDLPFELGLENPIVVRVGRQQFAFGGQRLVSPLPWANSLRTWDGVRMFMTVRDWSVDTFVSEFVPVAPGGIGKSTSAQKLYGVYAKRQFEGPANGLEMYALRNEFDGRSINGTTGDEKRWTLGARRWGLLTASSDYEVELSYQTGSIGSEGVSAWSIASKFGYSLKDDKSLKLWAGFDWASGDDEAGGEVNTFSQLYPLGHAYFGIADVIGRQNIMDTSVGLFWKPQSMLTINFALHSFWVDSISDSIYNPGGGSVRLGGSYDSESIGLEADATLKWKVTRRLSLDAGYAHFFPESAIDQSGPAEDIDFFYLGSGFVF